MEKYKHYIALADLFRYPSGNFPEVVNNCVQVLLEKYPKAAEELVPFAAYVKSHTADEREELYTKTFDVQPVCYLDLGYVIFGEDYKRGAFLLHMQHEQLIAQNDCGSDLADNLCNVLTLYCKSNDSAFLDELAVKMIIPGIKKMILEFDQARIDLKAKVLKKLNRVVIQEELNSGNVYRNAFLALLEVLEEDFKNIQFKNNIDPTIDMQHHQSFLGKQSVNFEVNNLVNNYKLD